MCPRWSSGAEACLRCEREPAFSQTNSWGVSLESGWCHLFRREGHVILYMAVTASAWVRWVRCEAGGCLNQVCEPKSSQPKTWNKIVRSYVYCMHALKRCCCLFRQLADSVMIGKAQRRADLSAGSHQCVRTVMCMPSVSLGIVSMWLCVLGACRPYATIPAQQGLMTVRSCRIHRQTVARRSPNGQKLGAGERGRKGRSGDPHFQRNVLPAFNLYVNKGNHMPAVFCAWGEEG